MQSVAFLGKLLTFNSSTAFFLTCFINLTNEYAADFLDHYLCWHFKVRVLCTVFITDHSSLHYFLLPGYKTCWQHKRAISAA